MVGKKESTLETPAKAPSSTSERSVGLTPQSRRAPASPSATSESSCSMMAFKKGPITPKVRKNTVSMMPTKSGIAQILWVRSLSISTERRCSLVSPGRTTVSAHRPSMKV